MTTTQKIQVLFAHRVELYLELRRVKVLRESHVIAKRCVSDPRRLRGADISVPGKRKFCSTGADTAARRVRAVRRQRFCSTSRKISQYHHSDILVPGPRRPYCRASAQYRAPGSSIAQISTELRLAPQRTSVLSARQYA
eukprot:3941997-Rhodomonas_salina.1